MVKQAKMSLEIHKKQGKVVSMNHQWPLSILTEKLSNVWS